MVVAVSIHAPREGSDPAADKLILRERVSIHAPREGSDFEHILGGLLISIVSIHAPREGSDDTFAACVGAKNRFQSTLPVKGATMSL